MRVLDDHIELVEDPGRRRHSRKSAIARSTAPPDLRSAAARRQEE
jgi:hypothetical protein